MSVPRVSVIVVNYNGAHLLPACLDSLTAQDYPDLEILVVDNASVDDSKAVVGRYPAIRWIGLPSNEGLGSGYNAGAKEAAGELLFFVNNDTQFEPDCVYQLVRALKNDVLATDPLQMDWEGRRIIHGAQRFRCGWRYLLRPVPFIDPYQDLSATQQTETPWGCAGALMFDRQKFQELGGFDTTFFLDYEDMDICWRGWLQGWRTLFVPAARLRHCVGESEDRKLVSSNIFVRERRPPPINDRRQLSQYKNAQRFILKMMPWPTVFTAILMNIARILSHLLQGHLRAAALQARASLFNIRELSEILRERRSILRQSVTTSLALLQRWGPGSEAETQR